jgi:hypothetical protein
MDHDELERLCTALSQNTSAHRLDLEQYGAHSGFFFGPLTADALV